MSLRKIWVLGLVILLSVSAAHAKRRPPMANTLPLTPEQSALIQRAIQQEHQTIQLIRKSTPVVQTYIQNMRPDPLLYSVPVSDDYSLARVDFSRTFTAENYSAHARHHGFFAGTVKYLGDLTKSFRMSYSQTGFMDMMFMDPTGFDMQHYDFAFVRHEFLGSIRTAVFDVRPKPTVKGYGRFFGRIWVQDPEGHIVRFNGTFTGNKNDEVSHYFHFDSWRTNIQPGEWLPTAIYVEETHQSVDRHAEGFSAQTHFWGYSLKLPQRESTNESIQVENAEDQSGQAQDVTPLEAQRMWVTQAEDNVLDRLTQAGLLAPPSDFDKVLETVTNNIIIGSKLNLPQEIHCRVLLTDPLESLAVGNTIIVSKGLIDTLPTEADLAAVLSFQLAHIVLGHHIDTRYAFNDRLLFPDSATFQQINMRHTIADDEAAAKKAVELFNASVYANKTGEVGLYFEQLAVRQKALTALLTPRLGDSLLRPDGTPWLSGLTHGAPRLNPNNLTQVAALPLNSRLRIDPWDDKVYQLNVKPATLLNPSDKMPFQVTPVYFRLEPYQPPAQPVPTSTPAGQGAAPSSAPAAADQGPAQGSSNPPPPAETNIGPTQGTSNPPPANTNQPQPQ
ncbi:MAG TPA: M48 family metalloprotease [Acidobacteriaceae bacterium]|nr:M48 family metalloprotease [Acidobacteriaceae bacterium]